MILDEKELIKKSIIKLTREGKLGKLSEKEIPKEIPFQYVIQYGNSTSIAFPIAKRIGSSPQEVAIRIAHTAGDLGGGVKVEPVNGYINFPIPQERLIEELQKVAKEKEKYGASDLLKGKKIMIEFTDPNPFKEFHVGHLYSNAVGESIARLLEANGAKLKRANYQGDVGLHVAKAIWGMQKSMAERDMQLADLEKRPLEERVQFLGAAYAAGAKAYEESEQARLDSSARQAKKEIEELNKKIFAKSKDIKELYEKGRKWSLEKFEELYRRLGTKFDYYYFERDAGERGLDIVRKNISKGIFQESEGAVIFPGEKYGLHNRVFINSQGLPTYEAKELGLAPAKYKDFKYDRSIIVTGNEIVEYFKVLIAALKQIYPELGEKTVHLSHGMVRLPEGKISSRKGSVITGEALLDEVKERARKFTQTPEVDLSAREKEEVAEKVAMAAVKYSLLRVALGKDIIFDFEKSLSLEGDSGPYLLYTFARCRSILRKARNPKFPAKGGSASGGKIQNLAKEELDVLRTAYKFPEVVSQSAEHYAPNLLCSFAFDLAQAYNAFYNAHRVLEADTPEQKRFRLLLTAATAQLLQNALRLLGIQTTERM